MEHLARPTPEASSRKHAFRHQLELEYLEKVEARDPDVLEVSRNFADNDATPWRVESFMGLALIVLFGSVAVLIVFFALLKALIGR